MTSPPQRESADADALVVRAKTDREAFGSLYDQFFPLVHRYCRRRLVDRATADDIASEVFLQVARAMRRFPGKTAEDFRRWVYRIATNCIIAHWRKSARREALKEDAFRQGRWNAAASSDMDSPCRENDANEVVLRALAHLSSREQTMLTLRYLEGMSTTEVASIVGIRDGAARVAISRALKNLRVQLENPLGALLERKGSES